jgi:hypothetical protein
MYFLTGATRTKSDAPRLGGIIMPDEKSLYDWLIKNGMSKPEALKLVQGLRKVPSPPPGPGPNAQGTTRNLYGPTGRRPKGEGFSPESLYKRRRGW